jgi:hypothetical protein
MALLSFRGISTPSLTAQGEQRRHSFFNIRRGIPGSWQPNELPNLTDGNRVITSPLSRRYNCIGWAAGIDVQWWWPVGRYYWPPNVPREETVEAFVRAFATIGYIECQDGSLEAGFEKVAIYAAHDAGGGLTPTHAARQFSDGRWTSRLGSCEDIEHTSLEDVNCRSYGAPVVYLRRPQS